MLRNAFHPCMHLKWNISGSLVIWVEAGLASQNLETDKEAKFSTILKGSESENIYKCPLFSFYGEP